MCICVQGIKFTDNNRYMHVFFTTANTEVKPYEGKIKVKLLKLKVKLLDWVYLMDTQVLQYGTA